MRTALLLSFLVACTPAADPDPADDSKVEVPDTDPVGSDPTDSEPETDPTDTEPDTDPADTDPVDTDPPADTDPDDSATGESPPHTADSGPGDVHTGVTESGVDSAAVVQPPTLGGGFVDLTAPLFAAGSWPAPTSDEAHTPIGVGQLDDDAPLELLILSPTDPGTGVQRGLVVQVDPTTGDLVTSGSLPDPVTAISMFSEVAFVGLADLDGDADDELFLAGPGGLLYDGTAPGQFNGGQEPPVPAWASPRNTGTVALVDWDEDGWLDYVIASPSSVRAGDLSGLLLARRTGPQTWENGYDLLADPRWVRPYAVQPAWWADELVLVALGDVDPFPTEDPSPGFFRVDHLRADGLPVWVAFDPTPATALWKTSSLAGWNGVVYPNGAPLPYRNPMGGVQADLDGDGAQDLVVSPAWEKMLGLSGGQADQLGDLTPHMNIIVPVHPGDFAFKPWGVVAPDLDQDGHPDLVTAYGWDFSDSLLGLPLEGLRASWNEGDGRFQDITDLVGIELEGNYGALCTADLQRDGDADLLVGGTFASRSRVLRNDIVTGHHGLSLALRGSTSNALGIGARVEVHPVVGGPVHHHVMAPNAAMGCLSEVLVFVGLGDATEAELVRIEWPSGLVHEVGGLVAGTRHVVEEPPTVVLSEADRHLPADGATLLTIDVWPRDAAGAVRAGVVTIEASHGHAGWSGPVQVEADGRQHRTMVAPVALGTTVVTVTIDGVPVEVRPRVWWDAP